MGKRTLNTTIDEDLWLWIKMLDINASQEINYYFRQRKLAMETPEMQEYQALMKQINKVKAERDQADKTMAMLQVQLADIEKRIAKEKERDSKRRSEKESKIRTVCLNCGGYVSPNEKAHNFGDRIVCHACFITDYSTVIEKVKKIDRS